MSIVVRPASENPRLRIRDRLATFVAKRRLARLDAYREHLAVDHPYRHALDSRADTAFARIACECDDPCACPPGGAL